MDNKQSITTNIIEKFEHLPDEAVVRLPVVLAICGISKPTIYRLMGMDLFPKQFRISPGSVGWRVRDIRNYLANL